MKKLLVTFFVLAGSIAIAQEKEIPLIKCKLIIDGITTLEPKSEKSSEKLLISYSGNVSLDSLLLSPGISADEASGVKIISFKMSFNRCLAAEFHEFESGAAGKFTDEMKNFLRRFPKDTKIILSSITAKYIDGRVFSIGPVILSVT